MKEMSTIKFPNQTEAYEIVDATARLNIDNKSDIGHTHTVSEISDFAHEHDERYYTETEIDTKLNETKEYADNAAATIKNELLNGAGEAYDTLKELGDLISENVDAIDALETVATGKADKEHTHAISDVTNLQDTLDAKATQENLNSHTSNTNIHITADERDAWNLIEDNAKAYTDQQIAAIPTPDVSGQIEIHNTDSEAHQDIREMIVQSDWNQNDETALDYVKNRTHWIQHAETLLNSEVFECTTLATDSTSYYCAKSGNIGLVSGNKYNVIVNGTTYTASALTAFGTNDIALIAEVDKCRIYDRESGVVEVFTDSSTTLTVSIMDAEDVYVKLDEKFIPDVFAHLEDVELKMDKENPTGSGALSINRASGSEIGVNSVAIGTDCIASGASAIAIGSGVSATGFASHAEGNGSVASGDLAHAEGQDSKATGYASHAESSGEANGDYSHAEGYGIADGNYSHASGNGTWAVGRSQTVIGEANLEDSATDAATRGTYAVIVGNGDMNAGEYSNAATLDWEGNAWFAGDVYVGSADGTNKDDGSVKLATVEYVDSAIGAAIGGSY